MVGTDAVANAMSGDEEQAFEDGIANAMKDLQGDGKDGEQVELESEHKEVAELSRKEEPGKEDSPEASQESAKTKKRKTANKRKKAKSKKKESADETSKSDQPKKRARKEDPGHDDASSTFEPDHPLPKKQKRMVTGVAKKLGKKISKYDTESYDLDNPEKDNVGEAVTHPHIMFDDRRVR